MTALHCPTCQGTDFADLNERLDLCSQDIFTDAREYSERVSRIALISGR